MKLPLFLPCAFMLASSLIAMGPSVGAQPYPSRPVHLIVGHPAGVGVDVDARVLARQMSIELGQPVLVENRPGFATLIAMVLVAKAAPDGYTIGMGLPPNLASHPRLYDRPPFDIERDVVPVTLTQRHPWSMYVHSSVEAKTLAELIALAKRRPESLTYATTGVGSLQHLATEWLMSLAGVRFRHIPYGTSGWTTDFVAGRIDVVQWTLSDLVQHARAGRIRALAISTGAGRSVQLPDVPTFAEAGFAQFDFTVWAGIVAPAATPRPVIDRLHAAAVRAVNSTAFREHVAQNGGTVVGNTPEEFDALLKLERQRWKRVIADAGIKLE